MDARLMGDERPRVPSALLVSSSAATNQSPDVPGSGIIHKMVQIQVFTLLALKTPTRMRTHKDTHTLEHKALFSSSWVQEALGCVCVRTHVCVCVRVRACAALIPSP